MAHTQKSPTLYAHPFSKAYWRDAFAEVKDIRMLVITALLIALRVALKPLAIPLGPQLSIQTAMLATALGAMVFGPVMAIPAAIISDTIGFIIYPTGEYVRPFVLTEIASTVIYALCLYRAKPSTVRVMIARFAICFFVNVVLQQLIFSWQYTYMGNPEKAKEQIVGIFGIVRIVKNLCMFPIETVVLTLFLKFLVPVTRRVKLTYAGNEAMKFTVKQIISMVVLVAIGASAAIGYLTYLYGPENHRSRSADYTTEQRMEANKEMAELVLERTDDWDNEKVFCVVDSAYRELFDPDTDYTVSVYILDAEAFAAGQAADEKYTEDTLWGYSKSGPGKDKHKSLIKVATVTMVKNESTGEITDWTVTPVE